MSYKIQFRRGTAAQWTSANPTLANGEIGYETDTAKMKIGDGSTAWTSLAYWAGGPVGDVDGPSSATDNAVARFDTTTGKLIQNSVVVIDDTGNITGAGTLNTRTIANWVDGPASATDNALARFDATTGKLVQNSVVTLDDTGNLDHNNHDLAEIKNALFNAEYDNGNSGSSKTVNFNMGQKQRLELNAATVTLTLAFPGVGNYVLRIVQDATTQCSSLTINGSPKFPDGDLVVGAAANAETILTIYYDGSTAYIASIPNVETGTVSFE